MCTVYLSVGHVQAPCKTAEPIEVPCDVRTLTGQRNYALDELGPALADMGFLERGGGDFGNPERAKRASIEGFGSRRGTKRHRARGGVTSHPSHPLDPPLSGSSDKKAIPRRHLKAR